MSKKLISIFFFAVVLTMTSGLVSRQKSTVSLTTDDSGIPYSEENPGSGVAFVTISEGFPFTYINNENAELDYEIKYGFIFLNFLTYSSFVWLALIIFKKVFHENLRD